MILQPETKTNASRGGNNRGWLAASGVSPPSYKGAATARSLLTHSHPCIHIHTYTYMITIRLREASVSYLRVLAPLRKKREGEAIELLAGVTDGGDMNAHSSSRHCIGTCRCGYAPSARLESVLGYGCRGRLSCAAAEPLRTLGCARRVDPRAQRIARRADDNPICRGWMRGSDAWECL